MARRLIRQIETEYVVYIGFPEQDNLPLGLRSTFKLSLLARNPNLAREMVEEAYPPPKYRISGVRDRDATHE